MTYEEFKKWHDPIDEYLKYKNYFNITFTRSDGGGITHKPERLIKVIKFIFKTLGEEGILNVHDLHDHEGELTVKYNHSDILRSCIELAWYMENEHQIIFDNQLPF